MKFFWRDKTGRGFTGTFSAEDLMDWPNERSWDGDTLEEWLDEGPAVGDKWENEADEIMRTE